MNHRHAIRHLACVIGLMTVASTESQDLVWHAEPGYRWAQLAVQPGGRTGFTLLSPAQSGIAFTNSASELATAANRILLNGAGLATGDFDGDGWVDLYLCSLEGQSRLYRNRGQLRFEDVTQSMELGLH
ncbi:MAG: VCBS repeat-containing protein [Verrucomicrobiota bacterium]